MLAVVTGASRGIGRAIALGLGRNGYDVAVNYNHSEAEAIVLCDEIRALGVKANIFQADVSVPEEASRLFTEIKSSMGTVNVLVNNAGITRDGLLMRMKLEDWQAVISANLNSCYYCTKEAIRDMAKAHWGRVINIASVVGLTGNAGQSNYAASKAGIIGFTKSIAREYASRGITANAVAPGFIETSMTDILKPEIKADILRSIPAGTIGKPEDVAETVIFLASEKSRYITGQVIAVDGGMTMC